MEIKKVMIAGCGTMGAQIAWQIAFRGFEVTVWNHRPESLATCREKMRAFAELFIRERGGAPEKSIAEDPEIKREFWSSLSRVAPPKTIFTTNTSTMLPSQLAAFTDRPERFLALHFINGVWNANIAEIMCHPGTDPAVRETVTAFAEAVGMVPIPIEKEQPGYIINAILIPWLQNAMQLLVNGVADYRNIDRTWMISCGMKQGPFGIIDFVGIDLYYNIEMFAASQGDENAGRRAAYLKEHFLDQGLLGFKSAAGFYRYPDPEYAAERFLLVGDSER